MTGGQRSVALVIACWLIAGCELTLLAAETGAHACSDEIENDGDRLSDCDDPDCWTYAHCRLSSEDAGVPLQPELPPHVPNPGNTHPPLPPAMDAAVTPVVDASVVLDAAVDDAEVDAAPTACEACPDGPCIDGECAPSAPLGRFRVVNLRVIVPTREPQALGACFDTSLACDDRFFGCCDPDPIVTMRVDGAKVGSLTAQNAVDTVWSEPGLEVELRNGSKIEFELADDDALDLGDSADSIPDLLFWCWTIASADNVLDDIVCRPEDDLPPPTLESEVGVIVRLVRKPDAAP